MVCFLTCLADRSENLPGIILPIVNRSLHIFNGYWFSAIENTGAPAAEQLPHSRQLAYIPACAGEYPVRPARKQQWQMPGAVIF